MSISRLGLVLLTACTSSTLAPPVSAIEPAPSELRDERFVAGEYVSLSLPSGKQHTYVVARVVEV